MTLDVLQMLIAAAVTRLQDAEERLAALESTLYDLELRLTALEAKDPPQRS